MKLTDGSHMGNATAAGMGRQAGVRARAHAGTGIACVDAGTMPGAACRQMPLSFLGSGETATIAKVRGKGDLHHHLGLWKVRASR